MRVLFTTQVGSGHWRPLAPFARALQGAGHEVAFATTPFGCPVLAEHGFLTFPAGIDDWRSPPPPTRSQAAPSSAPEQAASVWARVFVGIRAARAIPDLLAICAAWHPDLIVREMTEFGGCVVAERLGLPHAAVQVGAYRPDLERSIATALDRERAAVGLPPDPDRAMLYRYLLLTPVPPSFQDPDRPLPPTAHAVRWESFDGERATPAPLPAWAERLPARPTIFATLGTAYNRTPGVFPAILDGLRGAPVNLIVALGPNLDPATYGPQPAHIHLERYLSQSRILPRCDLVVAHGGYSTVMTTLACGLPLVLLPIAADMFDNARRRAALGVGQVVGPHERTPESIHGAVEQVLGMPVYREHAQRMRSEIHTLPSLDQAAALLERLAVDKLPILAKHTGM